MKIPLYQLDAFSDRVFAGNPAAVCPLEAWLPEARMQAIADENNLSETAFFVPRGADYDIRWFTPKVEVPLCGHATLAAAHVVLNRLRPGADSVVFHCKSGKLTVDRRGDLLVLDFPRYPPSPIAPPEGLAKALGRTPKAILKAHYHVALYDSEDDITALRPDMAALAAMLDAVMVTAPGRAVDFVSRFFAPAKGIPEDPVTGSAHCALIPYWSARLGKTSLTARQLSERGGALFCEDRGERVGIGGRVAPYLEGVIDV